MTKIEEEESPERSPSPGQKLSSTLNSSTKLKLTTKNAGKKAPSPVANDKLQARKSISQVSAIQNTLANKI